MLAHRMDCAVLVQNSGNAFSAPNGNCDSLKFTHKIIAKPSVWPISRKLNAAVSDFRCQVWKKNSEFNRLCQSNGNIFTFFTQKKTGDNNTRICGVPKILCYRQAEQKMFDEHPQKNSGKLFHEKCNCLPSCTSITYDADLDRVNLNSANSADGPGSGPGFGPGPKSPHSKPWYLNVAL